MRILGIDPGLAITGYAILDCEADNLAVVNSGSIQTPSKSSNGARLLELAQDLSTIIEKYNPDCASVEKLFYFKNLKTIMPVSEARGVIIMILEKYGVEIFEYTPLEVKQTITGYGRACKEEVKKMTEIALCNALPNLDDAVDAVAIALCHTRCCRV
ncbi:MAG: crossover junction endodeoxyribonuclease RuvC [Candidatus Gastranaerophilales bacterium]|nr:crossover junction endodeoxyribonuclease RuvC [Candidatus Gastranaerophilales bacterium]